MLSLEGAASKSLTKPTSTTFLMLGSTEANRSKAMIGQGETADDLSTWSSSVVSYEYTPVVFLVFGGLLGKVGALLEPSTDELELDEVPS
ncbi:hypothetical protein [Bradyrhizobium liaoningense]|uniref:hypothetical protein n=1 Tax=Bradyrhizobium liaoningense TaxID=43992 RepID=UPI001BAA86C9|nr:hypothetical protein [Bradyrhizobium liaoningense]MBR0716529.1 hypothetical protein [Bradyrhizobium liaoningense]